MDQIDSALDQLIGREVVIDVVSPFVYLGKLIGYDEKYLALERADVHDLRDTATTRELYVIDSKRLGIRANRERVLVRVGEIVSVSALEDVIV
jgi:small nuclear ribonucleoprotein (snRNP)-like protein